MASKAKIQIFFHQDPFSKGWVASDKPRYLRVPLVDQERGRVSTMGVTKLEALLTFLSACSDIDFLHHDADTDTYTNAHGDLQL